MKRLVMILGVVAIMAAIMAVMAAPAFAQTNNCSNNTNTSGNLIPVLNGTQLLNGNACGDLVGVAL